jgi:hypothetical protein
MIWSVGWATRAIAMLLDISNVSLHVCQRFVVFNEKTGPSMYFSSVFQDLSHDSALASGATGIHEGMSLCIVVQLQQIIVFPGK